MNLLFIISPTNIISKVVAWYDNEYGYSTQMVRTIKELMNK